MADRSRFTRFAALCAAAGFATVALAQTPLPGQPTVAGWDALVDDLRALAPKMLARLPESMRNDPQVQQEVGRLMIASIAARGIDAISADGDHPIFLPAIGQTLNVFQPNADTVYKAAIIAPGGVYRLRGQRGSARIAKIGEFVTSPADKGATAGLTVAGYHDINALPVDGKGRFDVLLSTEKPAGYTGTWWRLDPRTTRLMLRQVASNWAEEHEAAIAIDRLDAPATRPRLSAETLQKRLAALPKGIDNTALSFVDHVVKLRDEGFVNRLKIFDVSQMGALEGQFYYEGAYDLQPDEALIVEAKVPAKCAYHSVILTNSIYETTDWYNNHSSLNDAQNRIDKDGVLRVVVSAQDPGVPNWLDTAGDPFGVIQGRWTECSANPVPTIRKLKIGAVRTALPADTPTVTPAQRDAQIRDRRAELQQRRIW